MIPATYKKIVATQHVNDFRSAVEIQTVEIGEIKPDEIVIRNRFAGVNASDWLMASGEYLIPTPVPCDLGAESLGEVMAIGEDVTQVNVGDAVLVNWIGCGFCEYYKTRARYVIPVPVMRPEIMALSIAGLTAQLALKDAGQLGTNETVLITAAAGGTGHIAVQLAKLAGNHVIGTCGSDEKKQFLKSIGCDRVVNYREEELFTVLREEYPHGVDVVLDGVGGRLFDAALNNLAVFGRLVTIGFVSEYKLTDIPTVDKPRIYHKLIQKNVTIAGFNLNQYMAKRRDHLAVNMGHLVKMVQDGQLKIQLDPTPFEGIEQVINAVEFLHEGKNNGKVIVRF